jgi:hypothetical protein
LLSHYWVPGGWAIRYLHINEITANLNQSIDRATPIAKVNLIDPCFLSSGPHLHIDILYNGVYQEFNNKYIGGWQVKEGSSTYQGSLNLSFLIKVPANSTRDGDSASYVHNQGAIGDNWTANLVTAEKHLDGVTICNPRDCYLAAKGAIIPSTSQKDATMILLAKGYKVEFHSTLLSTEASVQNAGSTTINNGCLDFDVNDLQNYNFPGTEISLRDNSTEGIVLEGACNPNDRPIKKRIPTQQDGTTPIVPLVNFGCYNDQASGIRFYNNKQCFYMTSGKSSLPFSPTRIEVLDSVRKYDITMCNSEGQCDEFHNTSNIDYSSVARPFTRAEVIPQGLTSTDAVGSCKTSSGRALEFSTMQKGMKYYTDRSYTVKNIDKVELIGMRYIKTPNDDKKNGDPEYITCDIKKTTQIVIAFDGRNSSLPEWMRSSYNRMDREIGVTDNDMQHFDLYSCTQQGGYKLRLGGPQSDGASRVGSNYIVIFRDAAQDKMTDCSAKFNVPPDVPILNSIDSTVPLYSAPLLLWNMSDRNFTNDYLQAYVMVWDDEILVSTTDLLPIGVSQWVPIWNASGNYKAQVVIRDSKGAEAYSNIITYSIAPPIEACSATKTAP